MQCGVPRETAGQARMEPGGNARECARPDDFGFHGMSARKDRSKTPGLRLVLQQAGNIARPSVSAGSD